MSISNATSTFHHFSPLRTSLTSWLLSLTLVGLGISHWLGNPAKVSGQTSLAVLVSNGRYDQGIREYTQRMIAHPRDDEARFALSTLMYFRSIERVGQALYQHGFQPEWPRRFNDPGILKLPKNPQPTPLVYQQFRLYLQTLQNDLIAVQRTLGEIESSDVRVQLDLSRIGFDWDQSGMIDASELYATSDAYHHLTQEEAAANRGQGDMVPLNQLDRIDALWMRGNAGLAAATIQYLLAHDFKPFWEMISPKLFSGNQSRLDFIREEQAPKDGANVENHALLDLVTEIHLLRFRLENPAAVKQVHEQLLLANRCFSECLRLMKANGASQPAGTAGNPAERRQVFLFNRQRLEDAWLEEVEFHDQFDRILRGQLLLPFWRGTHEERGINLKRFLQEPPQEFDLVLMAHGSGLQPYLDIGDCSNQDIENLWLYFLCDFELILRDQ